MGRRKRGGRREAVPGAGEDVGTQRRYRKPRKPKQSRLEGQVDRIVAALADGEVQVSPRAHARDMRCKRIVVTNGELRTSASVSYRGWDKQEWDMICAAVQAREMEVVGDDLVVHANIW